MIGGGAFFFQFGAAEEKLRRFREEAGREIVPFEVIMVVELPWGLDDVKRAEDKALPR
jgi:hypothetical protein